MQRLFSTFPNGWPGCGLLLLRVTCGCSALILGAERLGLPLEANAWLCLPVCLTALLILAGFWTPIAATLLSLLLLALTFAGDTVASTPLLVALIAMSLVMLGPGAWSIDSRLYGRKRIDLGPP